MRFRSALVAATALLAACGPSHADDSASRPEPIPAPQAPAVAPPRLERPAQTAPEDHPVYPGEAVPAFELWSGRDGSSYGAPEVDPGAQSGAPLGAVAASKVPVALWIEGIEIVQAPVVAVGVDSEGGMEIPGGSEVGWYRFGPSPGSDGSAVLAAHVAFDDEDGVFRHLSDVSPGTLVVVGYDDGSTEEFEIVELQQYAKADLPLDEIFSKRGEPVLTLITCGGDFDRAQRSFADNVVARAVPV